MSTLTTSPARTCPHSTARTLRNSPGLAPLPCSACHGWVEPDGQVIDTATMQRRYPQMPATLAASGIGRRQMPDYRPGVADRLEAFGHGTNQVGTEITKLVLWAFVLAVIVIVGVSLLSS